MTKDKSQLWLYALFAIIGLIVIFGLAGKVISLNKENGILKQAVIEEQWVSNHRLGVINEYWSIPVCKQAYINMTRSLNG